MATTGLPAGPSVAGPADAEGDLGPPGAEEGLDHVAVVHPDRLRAASAHPALAPVTDILTRQSAVVGAQDLHPLRRSGSGRLIGVRAVAAFHGSGVRPSPAGSLHSAS